LGNLGPISENQMRFLAQPKNTFKKVSFSLFRFFWTSKRNENPSDNVAVLNYILVEGNMGINIKHYIYH